MLSLTRLSRSHVQSQAARRTFYTSHINLSGHNKWSKIKERKGANDLKKGHIYSKTNRDIMLAVRSGGNADPEQNTALAAVIKRAKAAGIPKDNIENALKKAVGGKEKGDQQLTYEAMGPGSVGIVIECLTDNANRTLKSMQNTLKRHGARFADVKFLFQRRGCVRVALDKGDDFDARMEKLIDAALEADAEDFEELEPTDTSVEVEFMCPPTSLGTLTAAVTTPDYAASC
ncbi:hypothetical protein A0H81_04562 [Grifola frondosa]|uniref:Transcriptional regulatory protein C8D2.12c n=1 Tax=Grifola frondosa TaxID=5627 RepID=A0A1C7ME24_GRIFR|nr:hypothetical protein A0H81_04562 [Grifola frondosa]